MRARGRQQRLLDRAHQRVQDPQLLLDLVRPRGPVGRRGRRHAVGHEDEVRRGDVERAHGRRPRVVLVQELDVLHLGSEYELHDSGSGLETEAGLEVLVKPLIRLSADVHVIVRSLRSSKMFLPLY